MTGFSRSANGQGHVAGDEPNGYVPFSCLEFYVAAEDVTSVAKKEMNRRSESSFVGVAVSAFYGVGVGVAAVSNVVVRTQPPSVAWRLA